MVRYPKFYGQNENDVAGVCVSSVRTVVDRHGFDVVGMCEIPNGDLLGRVGTEDVWLTYGGPGPNNEGCPTAADGHTCHPFEPESEGYYQGNHVDYVFVEKPKSHHDLCLDVSRAKMTAWHTSGSEYLADHVGVAFDLLTSPVDRPRPYTTRGRSFGDAPESSK